MHDINTLPNPKITGSGAISSEFQELGIEDFHQACAWVRALPYGYNASL